jgi:hypothetical protein
MPPPREKECDPLALLRGHNPRRELSRTQAGVRGLFVNLGAEQDTTVSFDYPRVRTASWEVTDEQQSPLLRRLASDERSLIFRGSEPRVKVPVQIREESSINAAIRKHRRPFQRGFCRIGL